MTTLIEQFTLIEKNSIEKRNKPRESSSSDVSKILI